MPNRERSPFGAELRRVRTRRGLSQRTLANLTQTSANPLRSSMGSVSERQIANLEAPARYVKPRANTVQVLAATLGLPSGSPEMQTFLDAAETTIHPPQPDSPATPDRPRQLFISDGREDHYQQLQAAWKRAADGNPQFIFLAGESGSGKTHLIRQLCNEVQEQHPAVRIAWGECTNGASSVAPYLPMLQAVNMLLGLADHFDGPIPHTNQQNRAIAQLLSIAPAMIGPMVDEPALVHRVESMTSEPGLQEQLHLILSVRKASDTSSRLDQVIRFFANQAAEGPIILVLEDLHWAGERMTSLLLHMQRQLQHRHHVPLLVIGSYWPHALTSSAPTQPHPLARTLNDIGRQVNDPIVDLSTSIGTERGRAFVSALLRRLNIISNDETCLTDVLFDHTEGNPLFTIEMIAWLQETGALHKDTADIWQLDASAIRQGAPARILAVIADRIDHLPAQLRKLLEAASVQGTVITMDFLPIIDDMTEDEIEDAIDTHLSKRYRLLFHQGTRSIAGKRLHVYRFRHALFRDYLYDRMSPREQEKLHALTAIRMLQTMGDGPNSFAGEIAFHFEKAHRYADAAANAYRAAQNALQQLNYELAQTWFNHTETYAREIDDRWHILASRNGTSAALRGLAQFDLCRKLAQSVAIDARREGFLDLAAWSEDLLGQAYYDKGGLNSAIRHLTQAVELYGDLGDLAAVSGSESMLSHTWYRLGAYDDALIHARRSYVYAIELGDDENAAEAMLAAANCEVDLGRYQTAIDAYTRAEELYARSSTVRGQIITALNIGLCHIQLGNAVEAASLLRTTRTTTETLRTPRLRAFACHYLSLAMEQLGDYDAAKREATEALKLRETFDLIGHNNDILATFLRIAIAGNDWNAARKYLAPLQVWTNDRGGDGVEDPVMVYLSLADAHLKMNNEAASHQAIEDGYQLIMERAAKISDTASRESYLRNVPANRKLLAWYQEITLEESG